LIVLAVLLIGFLLNRRHAIATHVVSTIAASIRLNLPLADALEQAGGGQNDRRSVLLRRIASRLRQGQPLSDAMRSAYPGLPGWIGGMVVAGERIDQLPAVLQAVQGELIRQGRLRFRPKPVHPFYALLLIFFTMFILSGMSVFIFPKFRTIFESFRADVPQITLTVMGILGAMSPFFWAFMVSLPITVPVGIYLIFRPRRPQAPRLLSWVGDFIKWHLPGIGWYEMMRGESQAAGMLQLSLSAGQTVDAALANLSAIDLNLFYGRRLRRWHRLVVGGRPPSRPPAGAKLAGC
jgi:type II secretory pathway component PulF